MRGVFLEYWGGYYSVQVLGFWEVLLYEFYLENFICCVVVLIFLKSFDLYQNDLWSWFCFDLIFMLIKAIRRIYFCMWQGQESLGIERILQLDIKVQVIWVKIKEYLVWLADGVDIF